jgi:hypothetical protein
MPSSSCPLFPKIDGAQARKLPSCNSADATTRLAGAVPQSACAIRSGRRARLCAARASAQRRRAAASLESKGIGFEHTPGTAGRAMQARWATARYVPRPTGWAWAKRDHTRRASRATATPGTRSNRRRHRENHARGHAARQQARFSGASKWRRNAVSNQPNSNVRGLLVVRLHAQVGVEEVQYPPP